MSNVQVIIPTVSILAVVGILIKLIYDNLNKSVDGVSKRVYVLEKHSATKEDVKSVKEDSKDDIKRVEESIIRFEKKLDKVLLMAGGNVEK